MKYHKVFDNKKFEIWATPDYDKEYFARKNVKCLWRCQILDRRNPLYHEAQVERIKGKNGDNYKFNIPKIKYYNDAIFYVTEDFLPTLKVLTEKEVTELWKKMKDSNDYHRSILLRSNWATIYPY